MNTQLVDQKAREMAQAAQNQIQSHERECAIRWAGTMTSMGEIKRILAAGLGLVLTGMLALIGFLATHPPH
jgi:hypothetical protein